MHSSSEDEDLRRALELSKKETLYICDSDEEMKRALELSLAESQAAANSSAVMNTPRVRGESAGDSSVLVISEDEFDRMGHEGSLLARLSAASSSSLSDTARSSSLSDVPRPSSLSELTSSSRLSESTSSNSSFIQPTTSSSLHMPFHREGEQSNNIPVSVTFAHGNNYNSSSTGLPSSSTATISSSSSSTISSSNTTSISSSNIDNGNRRPPTVSGAGAQAAWARDANGVMLSAEQATQRMRTVFERGLELQLNAAEMEPCRAISTKLHPHQKSALAWMFQQENKSDHGMKGGILADEMGLGKSLTVLALILTNHHDGKPLCKPDHGFVRPLHEMSRGGGKRSKATIKPADIQQLSVSDVGQKAKSATRKSQNAFKFFDFDEADNAVASSSSQRRGAKSFTFNRPVGRKEAAMSGGGTSDEDFVICSDDEEDEFDRMAKEESSIKCKLQGKSLEELVGAAKDPREEEVDKMWEEMEGLSEEEREKRLRALREQEEDEELPDPGLNLDGAFDDSDDSDDDFRPTPSVGVGQRRKRNLVVTSSSEDERGDGGGVRGDSDCVVASSSSVAAGAGKSSLGEKEKRSKRSRIMQTSAIIDVGEDHDNDYDMEHIDFEALLTCDNSGPSSLAATQEVRYLPSSSSSELGNATMANGQHQAVKRIIPPRDPAIRKGRRRPTLLVCPTSLMSHWCQEIDRHVDRSVDIRVKVHHGAMKSKLGADLNTYDIVVTTYGTLASEYSADTSPLQRAKWLRVVLDEGHMIKNHRTKSARAAKNLNTERRWVITGTPIQNNLLELWSLVDWLDFSLYAGQLPQFKQQIERPCKNRIPIGFERLQVLMDAICLRRTKADRMPNGEPIVQLPVKRILIRDVELTKEERVVYTVFNDQAVEVVQRYQRRGQLLRHYAHIFAMMTRMRQLCCHRELITTINWEEADRDMERLGNEMSRIVEAATAAEEGAAAVGGGSEALPQGAELQLMQQLRDMIKAGITDDCSICLDDLNSPVITPCAHVYCRQCIERVLETAKPPNCPLCRREVSKKQLLEASQENDEEGDRSAETEDKTLAAMQDIVVNQSSSKVNAALRELIRIRRDHPNDKMIVVSQFTAFLSILQPLLTENEFRFVRLDGSMGHMDRAEVVKVFQGASSPTSPQVLLLSLKAGGVGLNLTSANHLLLLDPAWNPASEWQCFDRTHRIGQEKEVFIYKFVTKNSIEEKMVEIQEKKKELISGAFHMPDDERRRQRVQDIINIFSLAPTPHPTL